ncbi:MAG TPA: hydrolase, partial [Pilimelia sp.]|nr:hydrolase [Pilimelia sp.]
MRSTLAAIATAASLLAPASGPARAAPEPPALGRVAASTATQLVLPTPTGRRDIGTVSLHLVDRSRPDPWLPARPAREIMVQLWYPARAVRPYPRAPWVSA